MLKRHKKLNSAIQPLYEPVPSYGAERSSRYPVNFSCDSQ